MPIFARQALRAVLAVVWIGLACVPGAAAADAPGLVWHAYDCAHGSWHAYDGPALRAAVHGSSDASHFVLTSRFSARSREGAHPDGSSALSSTCVATEGGGLTLNLSYKEGWSAAQRAAADQKVAALDEAGGRGRLQLTQVVRSGTSAATRYRQAGGTIPPLSDVDHTLDLQLGAADAIFNMNPLDYSVNRSLGAEIGAQLRGVPEGTCVVGVQIC